MRVAPCCFLVLLCLAGSGCIQEDPQAEAMRNRLEATEQQVARLTKQLGESSSAVPSGEPSGALAARNEELEAEVRRLTEENARLKKEGAGSEGAPPALGHSELLAKLEEASLPFREQIKSLYEIQQASLRELTIPEAPYSCVVRLDLLNRATGQREQVDVPATANLRGEWRFPPLDQVAAGVSPVSAAGSRIAASPSGAPSTAFRPGPGDEPGDAQPGPMPPPMSSPSLVPIPGELAGEKRLPLNW